MTRRAILQIGTEKTGTTSLQGFLAANRDRLREKGFIYPRFCGDVNQTGLAAYAMVPDRMEPLRSAFGIHSVADVAPVRQRLEAAADAELEGSETAIFCNEHCHSRLTSLSEIETLRRFLARYFDDIRVCIYLRRQDQVAVSLYSTRLKSGGSGTDILPRTNDSDPYFNYDLSLRLWEACFGQANVTVRLFDRKELADGSVISDFLRCWDIGTPEQFGETPHLNESISPRAQDFLRVLNPHLAPIEGLPLDAVLGPLSGRLAALYPGSGAKPTRSEAEAFYAMYRASNDAVRARYFPERETLFREDFSSYPERSQIAGASLEDFGEIAARLQTEATREIRRLEAEVSIRDARLLWQRGETEQAIATLRAARSWLPHHAPVYRVLGEYLLQSERLQEARKAAAKAAELGPDNFEYWHFYGVVLRRSDDLHGARDAQAKALSLNPGHEASRTCLTNIEAAIAAAETPPPQARTA
ncbi:tetratricopeptide repeat protein [Amaricoccus macauensis]|uniref:tetratricopeptide repeat protein n=1 Tax=Amaricoccus macauensis TaxID=57001 RepID=UPI003C7E2997